VPPPRMSCGTFGGIGRRWRISEGLRPAWWALYCQRMDRVVPLGIQALDATTLTVRGSRWLETDNDRWAPPDAGWLRAVSVESRGGRLFSQAMTVANEMGRRWMLKETGKNLRRELWSEDGYVCRAPSIPSVHRRSSTELTKLGAIGSGVPAAIALRSGHLGALEKCGN
jgi:hypothetical protein